MPALRFSLKWLMASVALAAFSIGALVNASAAWATIALTAVNVSLLMAVLIAFFGAVGGRPFAMGYLVGVFFYLLLWQAGKDGWFELSTPDLLTNHLVDRLYQLIAGELPQANASSGGISFWTGKTLTTAPASAPEYLSFRKIAHWLFACYVGLASGLIARRLRLRPSY
jgi:hypothetical protein